MERKTEGRCQTGPGSRTAGAARRILVTLALALAGIAAAGNRTARADSCTEDQPCAVDGGTYLAAAPPDWDGQTPLPVLLYFHGYRGSARQVLRNRALVDAVHGAVGGVSALLVAPDGVNNTWAHVGSPSSARDEIPFIDAVMADVRARWPVDENRLWVSGFSQGGSMAWDVACYRGDAFSAFLPVSGAFWRPHPDHCTGPVNLRHIHGRSDTVVPMAGRPIRDRWFQGDVLEGMDLWRRTDGCSAEPDRTEVRGRLTCETWNRCDSGRVLELCLHDGGHDFRADWITQGMEWADGLTAAPE